MAKDLVRTRRYVKKFMLMRANIQAVSLKIQTLRSTAAMANAMKGVTKAMGQMNKQVGDIFLSFFLFPLFFSLFLSLSLSLSFAAAIAVSPSFIPEGGHLGFWTNFSNFLFLPGLILSVSFFFLSFFLFFSPLSLSFFSYTHTHYLQMKLPQIQKIMMEFEKQSEIMDMKEEMMNDAIDDAMGDEDDEEER